MSYITQAAARCGFFMATVLMALGFFAHTALAQEGNWTAMAQPAAKLLLPDAHGKTVDLKSFKGQVVIVNFWATWCPPCVEEMPAMQALVKRHSKPNSKPALVLLGVNYHESAQKIRTFQTRQNIDFPLLRDAWHEASTDWHVRMLPTSFIVDGKGVVRWRVTGELDWASPAVAKLLQPLLTSAAH